MIVATRRKRIFAITPTKSGRRHDKCVWNKYPHTASVPPDVEVIVDTGFNGIPHLHDQTLIPQKATKTKVYYDRDIDE